MTLLQQRIPLTVWSLVCLLNLVQPAARSSIAYPAAAIAPGQHQVPNRAANVTDWFRKYDQIRRDAEMTLGDKFQSLLLSAKKPLPANAALASRMIGKYTVALAAMKQLKQIPETRELQTGYIDYFSTARKLFSSYLAGQKAVPFTNEALISTKTKLQELDRKNKNLDSDLRSKYLILQHKHS